MTRYGWTDDEVKLLNRSNIFETGTLLEYAQMQVYGVRFHENSAEILLVDCRGQEHSINLSASDSSALCMSVAQSLHKVFELKGDSLYYKAFDKKVRFICEDYFYVED